MAVFQRCYRYLSDEKGIKIWFLLPSLVFLSGLILYPVISAVWQSFHKINFFSGATTFVGLQNYVNNLSDPTFWNALFVNVCWTLGCLIGEFSLGLVVALLVNHRSKLMTVIRTILLLPYIIPVISLTLVVRWMLNDTYGIITYYLIKLGLQPVGSSLLSSPLSALLVVIAVEVYRTFPFVMISYWSALQGIPEEFYEAASLDGASAFQKLVFITLPNLKAITLSLLILRTIWEFNHFDIIYLLTRGGPGKATQHLPIMVHTKSMGLFDFGSATSISMLMGIVLSVAVLFYVKLFFFKEQNGSEGVKNEV